VASVSEIAGDIVAAGSAIAGLMLVYMGSLSTGYSGFDPVAMGKAKNAYRRRIWFAFAGVLFTVFAVGLALFGKWQGVPCAITASLGLLLLGLLWVVIAAIETALEIK
jgi:hypothetical protein